jgi:hypothetical protein
MIDGRIALNCILKEQSMEDVNWSHVAQERHKLWDLVNMVMNFKVPKNGRNIYSS